MSILHARIERQTGHAMVKKMPCSITGNACSQHSYCTESARSPMQNDVCNGCSASKPEQCPGVSLWHMYTSYISPFACCCSFYYSQSFRNISLYVHFLPANRSGSILQHLLLSAEVGSQAVVCHFEYVPSAHVGLKHPLACLLLNRGRCVCRAVGKLPWEVDTAGTSQNDPAA